MNKLRDEFENQIMSGNVEINKLWDWINKNFEPKKVTPNLVKPVIEYLNKATGKKFKTNGASSIKFIKARSKEGYTLDDFKKVIDIKSTAWLKTERAIYLRPETLFGTKMESYLNESFAPKLDPIEGLLSQLSVMFYQDGISPENRERVLSGEWPDQPWPRGDKAMAMVREIHKLKNNNGS